MLRSMRIHKARKILLIIGIVLIIVQLPWYVAVQTYAGKTQARTTATVIRLDRKEPGCTGDTYIRPDRTCDHSDRLYPVYEYFDLTGKRYEQDDRFFGEYKEDNPLGKFLQKHVGDTVTAYYTRGKPQEVIFMAGPVAYTAWLLPLYLALPVFIAFAVCYVISRLRN
jgi:hypothetical protein